VPPFFIARYETTQAQWRRLTGTNPNRLRAGAIVADRVITGTHPVENLSWLDARRGLAVAGLSLPSEVQWEYAARAGATTPWYTGHDAAELAAAANLADQAARSGLGIDGDRVEQWDDGFAAHAPVGSLRANHFGLYDALGNVWEWCANAYATDGTVQQASASKAWQRAGRGGAFECKADMARVSYRNLAAPDARGQTLGVRATLELTRR
jgi:formylglycine-generating enzyme required for sulfatase activity